MNEEIEQFKELVKRRKEVRQDVFCSKCLCFIGEHRNSEGILYNFGYVLCDECASDKN